MTFILGKIGRDPILTASYGLLRARGYVTYVVTRMLLDFLSEGRGAAYSDGARLVHDLGEAQKDKIGY